MKLRTLLMGAAASVALAPMAMAEGHEGERGRDGEVRIIYWQAVSILNPYLSGGTKDIESSSLVLEPLANYDPDGNLVPTLAAEIPTLENGGISEDLTSITWKLKQGVVWSDGSPLTAADAVFSADYCMHPEGGCNAATNFDDVVKVEALDDHTIKFTFGVAKPFPYGPLVGAKAPIIQKAQFADCLTFCFDLCFREQFGEVGSAFNLHSFGF